MNTPTSVSSGESSSMPKGQSTSALPTSSTSVPLDRLTSARFFTHRQSPQDLSAAITKMTSALSNIEMASPQGLMAAIGQMTEGLSMIEQGASGELIAAVAQMNSALGVIRQFATQQQPETRDRSGHSDSLADTLNSYQEAPEEEPSQTSTDSTSEGSDGLISEQDIAIAIGQIVAAINLIQEISAQSPPTTISVDSLATSSSSITGSVRIAQDPTESLPPPDQTFGNSFFEASFGAQLIALLSEVAVKRADVTMAIEQYQSRLIFELYQASMAEAEIEAQKTNEEIKKSNEAINGALAQMAVALATVLLLALIGAAAAKFSGKTPSAQVKKVDGSSEAPAPDADAASAPPLVVQPLQSPSVSGSISPTPHTPQRTADAGIEPTSPGISSATAKPKIEAPKPVAKPVDEPDLAVEPPQREIFTLESGAPQTNEKAPVATPVRNDAVDVDETLTTPAAGVDIDESPKTPAIAADTGDEGHLPSSSPRNDEPAVGASEAASSPRREELSLTSGAGSNSSSVSAASGSDTRSAPPAIQTRTDDTGNPAPVPVSGPKPGSVSPTAAPLSRSESAPSLLQTRSRSESAPPAIQTRTDDTGIPAPVSVSGPKPGSVSPTAAPLSRSESEPPAIQTRTDDTGIPAPVPVSGPKPGSVSPTAAPLSRSDSEPPAIQTRTDDTGIPAPVPVSGPKPGVEAPLSAAEPRDLAPDTHGSAGVASGPAITISQDKPQIAGGGTQAPKAREEAPTQSSPGTTSVMSNPASSTFAPISPAKIEARINATSPADAGLQANSPSPAAAIAPLRASEPSQKPAAQITPVPEGDPQQALPAGQQTSLDGSSKLVTPRATDPEQGRDSKSTRSLDPTSEPKPAQSATPSKIDAAKAKDNDVEAPEAETPEEPEEPTHWTQDLMGYMLETQGGGIQQLLQIGAAINEIIKASGEISFADAEARHVFDDNGNPKAGVTLGFAQKADMLQAYKDMVKGEVENFRASVKEMNESLESVFEAINEIAKQNKELAAAGRK